MRGRNKNYRYLFLFFVVAIFTFIGSISVKYFLPFNQKEGMEEEKNTSIDSILKEEDYIEKEYIIIKRGKKNYYLGKRKK